MVALNVGMFVHIKGMSAAFKGVQGLFMVPYKGNWDWASLPGYTGLFPGYLNGEL